MPGDLTPMPPAGGWSSVPTRRQRHLAEISQKSQENACVSQPRRIVMPDSAGVRENQTSARISNG